jgi:hypothetical protein
MAMSQRLRRLCRHDESQSGQRQAPPGDRPRQDPAGRVDNRPYSGCYVNCIIELWAQNNAYGKRINANLLAVQFYKDGQPFGDAGANASVNDFDAFDDESDDDIFG